MATPLISVVVVTYNSKGDIAACLESLLVAGAARVEIIVVDNASTDGTADLVADRYPSVRLLRSPRNLGFAGGNNAGFAAGHGDIVLVLNPDVQVASGAAEALAAAFAADPELGVAGAKLLFSDGCTIQHAGGLVDYPLATTRHRGYGELDSGQYAVESDVPFVTGACLAVRRETWQAIGGFDSGFYPVYYEDVDLCYRASDAGWRVRYLPQVSGLHRTSASLDQQSETYFRFYHANRLRFVLKHYTTQQLATDFLPAETQRLIGDIPANDRLASRQVYQQLWEGNMTVQTDSGQVQSPVDSDRLVADLEERWQVREQPFVSHVLLLGPLISAFRSAWNSVSTRWYVQPMLQQQVEFNQAVVRSMTALARAVDAQKAGPALLAARMQTFEERLAALESAVSRKQ